MRIYKIQNFIERVALSFVYAVLAVFLFMLIGNASADSHQQQWEELSRPYLVDFGVKIPVSDGTRLNATILRPRNQRKPLPVILTFTPYGADRYFPIAAFYAKNGYVAAIVEVRGRGDSDGDFVPYVNDAQDGHDVVEWLAVQEYSDGRVGMRGASYTGFLQWAIAALRPQGLDTIIPGAPPYFTVDNPAYHGVEFPYRLRWFALVAGRQRNTNFNSDGEFWNGLYAELGRGEIKYPDLDEAAGLPNSYWKSALQTPESRRRYSELNPQPGALAQIDIPILTITGIYDGAQRGTTEHFKRLLGANPAVREKVYMIIGPWSHSGVSKVQESVGGLDFGGAAAVDQQILQLGWFDWVFKQGKRPDLLKDQVNYFLVGPNEWRSMHSMESTDCNSTLVFSEVATERLPEDVRDTVGRDSSGDELVQQFVYDPGLAPISWGPYFGSAAGGTDYLLNDPVPLAVGNRGLVYESPPTEKAFDLVGSVNVRAQIELNVPDTDLAAVLYDVAPDGSTVTMAYDMLRARYRHGGIDPDFPEPGEFSNYLFKLTWVAQRIEVGHRLRLLLTSPGISHFFQRHPNTAEPVAFEDPENRQPATIRVKWDHVGGAEIALPITGDCP